MITKILLIIKALFTARKFWRGRYGRRCGNCRHFQLSDKRPSNVGHCQAHPKQFMQECWGYPKQSVIDTCGEWA